MTTNMPAINLYLRTTPPPADPATFDLDKRSIDGRPLNLDERSLLSEMTSDEYRAAAAIGRAEAEVAAARYGFLDEMEALVAPCENGSELYNLDLLTDAQRARLVELIKITGCLFGDIEEGHP